jgi:hypothetical protein
MQKKPWGRRILVHLAVGFISLILLILMVNWASMLLLQPRTPSAAPSELSWEEDLGSIPPVDEPPSPVGVPEPLGTFILPAVLSVQDAVEIEGGWVVLDRRLGKLHFIDNHLGLMKSTAGEGPGPGELREPVALTLGDSFLWILNERGRTLDRFSVHGEFQDRRGVREGGCLVGLAEEIHYIPDEGLVILRVCPATLPGPGTAFIESLDPSGLLTAEFSLPLGERGSRRIHLLRRPTASATGEDLFLGTWDAPCIAVLSRGEGASGGVLRHRCMPDFVRAKAPEADRSKIATRFQRLAQWGFLPMEVPDRYPWFDRIFSTTRGLVVRRILGEEERDLVLLGPLGKPQVSERSFPANTFVGESTVLAARDLLQGTEISIFPNPWR